MDSPNTWNLKNIYRDGSISEREEVHKKAFTKWLNSHLSKAYPPVKITNLTKDLSDGNPWLTLFEILLGRRFERSIGHSHIHNLTNIQSMLDLCKQNEIKLDGINAQDISEGNHKTILGLVWNIIVHFQMKGTLQSDSKALGIEKSLQELCQQRFKGYKDIHVTDFSTSWRDGKAFNAIIHSYSPDLFDFERVMKLDNYSRLDNAFTTASLEYNVPRLLEPTDVDVPKPDKKMITMYLTCLFERLEHANKSRAKSSGRTPVTRRTIHVGSVSSERTSSSSSVTESGQVEEFIIDAPKTVTEVEALPDLDVSEERVTHKQKYSLSSISDEETVEPEDMASNPSAIVHVETSDDGRTTTRIIRETSQGKGNKTVTTTKETRPGESFTTVRREFHTVQKPTVKTRTITRTIGGTSRDITSDISHVIPELSEFTEESPENVEITREGSKTITKKLYTGSSSEGSRTITEVREIRGGIIPDLSELTKETPQDVEVTQDGSRTVTKKIYTGATPDGSRTVTEVREVRGAPVEVTRDGSRVITETREIITTEEQIVSGREKSSSSTSSVRETTIQGKLEDNVKTTTFKSTPVSEETIEIDPLSLECESVFEQSEGQDLDTSADSAQAQEKILVDKLNDAAIALSNLEPRVKRRDSSSSVRKLIQERDQVEVEVNEVLKQGRGMVSDKLFDQEKNKYYTYRMDELERRMMLLKQWPIRDLRSVSNYDKLLDDKLKVVEATHDHLEPQVNYSFNLSDVEPLVKQRDEFDIKSTIVTHIGRDLITDKVITDHKEKHFTRRIKQLEKKTKKLLMLPIRELKRDTNKEKYLEEKLTEVESEVSMIEPRIKSVRPPADYEELVKDRNALKDKAHTVLTVGRNFVEYGALDKKHEKRLVGRMDELEKRTNLLWLLPIKDPNSSTNEQQNQFLEEMFEETEDDFSDIENRMESSITNKDNKILIKQRNEVTQRFHSCVKVLHEMISKHHVDKEQTKRYIILIEILEKRMKIILMWPLKELGSVTDYNKYLKEKLDQQDKAITEFEPKVKQSTRGSIDNTYLIKQRDDLHSNVQSTLNLGRIMISQDLIERSKKGEQTQRMNQLEKKLKALMYWPIIGRDRLFNKEEFLVEKLDVVESSASDLEPRIKRRGINASEQEELIKESEELELKANGVIGFGESLMEDKLFRHMASKDHRPRMKSLAKRVRLVKLWPIKEAQRESSSNKFLKDKLSDTENKVSKLHTKIRQSINNKDNKDLIKERNDVDREVQDVVLLGHGMIDEQLIDPKKAAEHQTKMNALEKRMKLLNGWPIPEQTSSNRDRQNFFVDNLSKTEGDINELESQLGRKITRPEEAETLVEKREVLECEAKGVIGLGRGMIEDKMIEKKNEAKYSDRLKEVEKKITYVGDWPILVKGRRQDYDEYYESKLIPSETSVQELAERYKKTTDKRHEQALNKERDEVDAKVYSVTRLGRGMIEGKFFNEEKEKDYNHRISNLESAMELLRKQSVGKKIDSPQEGENILKKRLKEADKSLKDFEKRTKKGNLTNGAQQKMVEERETLVSKVNDVVSFGSGMVRGKLVDENKAEEYKTQINDLKNRVDLLEDWPYKEADLSTASRPKELELADKLSEAEIAIVNMEPRVKKSIHNKDNKKLIKERDELNRNVFDVVHAGRRVTEEKGSGSEKDNDCRTRMDTLERKMTLLMGWPILDHTSLLMGLPIIEQASTRFSVHDRVKFLDHKLEEAEKDVASLESRVKTKNPSQNTVEALIKERKINLEPRVIGVIGLGNEMIDDKLVDMNREKEYLKRFEDLRKKKDELMIWPLSARDQNYDTYFEEKLTDVETAVDDMKTTVRKPIKTDAQKMALVQERNDLEMKVDAVSSLGRGMMEEKFFDENKNKEYNHRIYNVGRAMELLKIRPIGKLDSSQDYNKHFEGKLADVETSVGNIKQRIKEPINTEEEQAALNKERDGLDVKVYAVGSLGRGMLEDNVFEEKKAKEYNQRISNLERATKLLMMRRIGDKERPIDKNKEFDEELLDVEIVMSSMESRVKKAIHNKDNKDLIKERDDLDHNVHNVIRLGRGMSEAKVFDKDKDKDYQKRMNDLERRMRLLRGWPVLEHTRLLMGLPGIEQASTRLNVHDRVRFLDHKLQEAEKEVDNLTPQVRKKNLTQDEVKSLTKERDKLEPEVHGVIGLGVEMIRDNLVDMSREQEYLQRFENLQMKTDELMIWPISTGDQDYERYFEVKLKNVETDVDDMETKTKTPTTNEAQIPTLIKERDDLEMKVHAVSGLGRGMIEGKFFDENKDKEYGQRISNLGRTMEVITVRPIGKPESSQDYNKYFEVKLAEVENSVGNLKERTKKPIKTDEEQRALNKERDELDGKVHAVSSLGRGMLEDNVFEEKKAKEYNQRISNLERATKLLMMRRIGDKERPLDKKKEFDEELLDVEIVLSSMESRVKKAIHNKDNKDLISERGDLKNKVHSVIRLGRGMSEAKVFDKDKDKDYQKRMNGIERRMRLLQGWPVLEHTSVLMGLPGIQQASTRLNVHDRVRFLDHELQEAEKKVKTLQPRVRQKNLTQDEIKLLNIERENLEPEVHGVIGLGNEMINDKLVDMSREKEYLQRFEDLQKNSDELMIWPIISASGDDFDQYFENKLKDVEIAVGDLEPRIKALNKKDLKQMDLIEERDNLEMKVYAVSSLGQGMMEDRLLDQNKEKQYNQRMSSLKRKMKLLMLRPIGKMDCDYDYDKHLEDKLTEVETSLGDLKQRTKKPPKDDSEKKDLKKERDDVEMKVYAVSSLGRGLIEDQLIDENNQDVYEHRISNLERSTDLLTTIGEKEPSTYDHKKEFDEELLDIEIALSNMESRVKRSIHNKDNKDLIKKRDELYGNALNIIASGRIMSKENLFDKDKEVDYQTRMYNVERRMHLLMGWPIHEHTSLLMGLPGIEHASTQLSVHDRVRFLDNKLEEAEKDVVNFERSVKKKNISKDKVETLTKERDILESRVIGVIGLGNVMIKDNLVEKRREKEYLRRFENLQRKTNELKVWPIVATSRLQDYEKYYENKLEETETTVRDLEPRIKKPTKTRAEQKALLKERDDVEMKVYATTSLGRGMIQDKFIDHEKGKEYSKRILNLERATKVMMMRPIGKVNSDQDYDRYYEEKLVGVESAVENFEPRIKKPTTADADQKELFKDRENLESKVYAVSSLGNSMMEDGLLNEGEEKQYINRISNLQRSMKLLMLHPIRGKASSQRKDFDEELLDAELGVTSLESRAKKAIHNKDNKDLITERDDLDHNVHNVIRLGRGMSEAKVFDKDKDKDYQKRMNDLERRMRLLRGWPVLEHTSLLMGLPGIEQASTRFSVHDRVRFLDHKLQEAEKEVDGLQPRVRRKNLTKNEEEILSKERENLEPRVIGVIGLGNEMIKDNLVDKNREKEYLKRFEDLRKKKDELMIWPIIIRASEQDYYKYFEGKLTETESAVADLEPRIKESIDTRKKEALANRRDDLEMKVYAVSSIGRGMIQDKFFDEEKDNEYDQRITKLQRSMNLLMMRPIGKIDSNQDYEEYFEDKLSGVENSVKDLKPRIKKPIVETEEEQKNLIKERDELEMKVYAISNLGRGMLENNLVDEKKGKEYNQRITSLERAMKMIMWRPLGDKDRTYDHKKTFDERLSDAETTLALLEPRVKKSIHNKDNKDLIEERDDLDQEAHHIIRLGRGMLKADMFDKEAMEYRGRMDTLEKRMRLLMGWPILDRTSLLMGLPIVEQASTRLSVHDRVRFLDHKLEETEKEVEGLRPRVKERDLTKEEVEALTNERDNLDSKVHGVVGMGCEMIRDDLVSKNREQELLHRFDRLEMNMKELQLWPLITKASDEDYDKYFVTKLTEVESEVSEFEPRIRKSMRTRSGQTELIKERDDLEMKVYAVSSLGRGMIQDKFFEESKDEEYSNRITTLERNTKLLMMRPIGTLNSDTDYEKYFAIKLREVESAVGDLEPRVKESVKTEAKQTELLKERNDLEMKVYGVASLGRGMIEDQLLDEDKSKEYDSRISNLEHNMKHLMVLPIGDKDSYYNKKEFVERLLEAEMAMSGLEPRVKKAIHNTDNKDLMDERDDLNHNVHQVNRLGRGMLKAEIFDKDKQIEYQKRLDHLEKRMRLLMGWPILQHTSLLMGLPIIEQASTRLSVHDRVRFLDHKLHETEKEVDEFEPRLRQKDLSKVEVEALNKGRKDLEPKVYGVIGLGVEMIRDNLIDMNREQEYLQRFESLEMKMKELMLWPVIEDAGQEDYDKYFEEKMTQVETSVRDLEPRIKKPMMTDTQQTAMIKERDNVEMDVYTVTNLGHSMIEDKFLDKKKEKEYTQRIMKLQGALRLLLLWPIGKLNSVHDRDKFLENNLQKSEEAVRNFEQRAKKKDVDDTIKEMGRERDHLISKVEEVVDLGRDMVNGKLVDCKKADDYSARMDNLDIKMGLLKSWPHADRETVVSLRSSMLYKDFDEQLTEMEMAVIRFEPRVKQAIHNKDNKELINERKDLHHNVQNVIHLGRGMIEAQMFVKEKDIDYQKRMNALERRMKLIMGWPIMEYSSRLIGIPILEQTGDLLHFDEREKFLDEKLHEAEVDIHELEPRIKEKDLTLAEKEALTRVRDDLEPSVLGVGGLGRKMIEDNLVDKKKQDSYRQRINDLEARMKLLMCWPFNDANETHDAFYEERLRQVEVEMLSLEDRAGKEDLDGDKIKVFIKARSDLEDNVYRVTSLGRGMLQDGRFSDAKEQEYIDRMDDVEKRMRMLFDWPDGPQKMKPIPPEIRDYDTQLRKMEVIVSKFEQRAKVSDRESFDLQSVKNILDNIKSLKCERDQLEIDVYEVLTEGRVLFQETEIDVVDMAFYTRRMNRLEERIRLLKEWLQSEMIRLSSLYIILIKQHLERLHDWLVRAEVKMDLEYDIGPNHDAVVKQLDEHLDFHKEVGLFSTVNMILEIDMDDPGLDEGLHQDVKTLSERWAAVWNWSEERKNRLLAVIAGWEKFREEEQKLYAWLVGKNEAIQMSNKIDISDEDQVEANMAVLKNLIQEIKDREEAVIAFRETGEQLISEAQYNDKIAKTIRDEVNDFDECWRTELDRAQRRKIQLQEARQIFLHMADLKRDVNEWLEESEALINVAGEERDDVEEEQFQNKIEIQCEEREFCQRRLEKINTLDKELAGSIEKDSHKEINYVVELLNNRMRETSENLNMYRDNGPLSARENCCFPNYGKKNAWESEHRHEIPLK